ncbi:MAG: SDR family oxidoreductase [Deltaproteobacteria bacterium]|uniref:SDR family oxidoreductase n=1 Tax=Candidatus Zymogenus saltonus TaxID=2844893 RepID=A0A9D8PKH7_9DELT|nr:SDR family oxidoreductase [Candidatus Zymogenus saltonus]
MADIKFDGRVAIVTGAGAGLGKTYALELAKRGCKVVVNDLGGARDGTGGGKSAADAVVDEIKAAGGEAAPNYDSVATIEGGKNIVKTAVDNFGKVDIVINNAGILRDKSFLKMEEDMWDIIMAVHLRGAYCVTQPAYAIMRENNYGRVVFTTSGAGLYGNFGQSNYSAAKMGLLGLMNTLKLEGAKYNVLVNTIAPVAASRLTEDVMPPEFFEKLRPEFITPLVVYLSSEDNKDSGYVFNAGMGWYSRTAVMIGEGTIIGDGKRDIKAEEIKDNWKKITDMSKIKEATSVQDTFAYMMPVLTK